MEKRKMLLTSQMHVIVEKLQAAKTIVNSAFAEANLA
jgi:hypothetical protein